MAFTVKTVITNTATSRMLRMMEEAKRVSGKTTEQIVNKHTTELAYNLFRRCRQIAPAIALLKGLPEKLNWRIRRPKGTTALGEIRYRIQTRFYLSACWIKPKRGAKVQSQKNKRGEIQIKWPSGPFQKGYVWLINRAKNKRSGDLIASEIHEKYGIVSKAMNDTTRNMIPYIRRKRGEAVKKVKTTS